MSSSVITDLMCMPYRLTRSQFLSSRNCHVHVCRDCASTGPFPDAVAAIPDVDVQSIPVPPTYSHKNARMATMQPQEMTSRALTLKSFISSVMSQSVPNTKSHLVACIQTLSPSPHLHLSEVP